MLRFRKTYNFWGQVAEHVLKSAVKNRAKQTQCRVNVFASQCADCQFESSVYKQVYDDMDNIWNGKIVTS